MSDMSASINISFIRALPPVRTFAELEALRAQISDEDITESLLDAIERGSLPTSTFAAWLSVYKSPVVIEKSLRQKVSVRIRSLGIKQIKKGLESAHWKELWDGLGGTAGLLDIFGDLSVLEVQAICKAIGSSARVGETGEKRAQVTELFKSLHPFSFPDAKIFTTDLRPLTKYYQRLIPSCTEELVKFITHGNREKNWRYVKEHDLLEQHSSVIGETTLRLLSQGPGVDVKTKARLQALSTKLPSTATPEFGFSTSMAFAFDLLRELVEAGSSHVDDLWVVDYVIRPLLKRAVRKHISWSGLQSITSLALRYLAVHHSAAKALTNSKGDVLHLVALCWSRRSYLFEKHLISLLHIVFSSTTYLDDFTNLLTGVPKSRRYPLLQLCCQEVMGVDLDAEQGLQGVRGPLTPDLLDSVGAAPALKLFRSLRDARGDAKLVEMGQYTSVLVTTRAPDVYEGDPDIYYLVLLNRNAMYQEAELHAASMLEARKKATRISSNREIRAEHAVSVWACALASGSLRLFSETLQWAKPFVRDQLTASKLFSTHYVETYKLLSGFLAHNNKALTPQELRQRVEQANAIMLSLLEIASSASREPFFLSWDWTCTLEIFTRVVTERIELSTEMKREMRISDKDIYCALWEDTIATLIHSETLVNQEEYENLNMNKISGIVNGKTAFSGNSFKATKEVSTWKFLDNLAKARNDLWKELRPARYPDVLTLPEPFPRGLSVHHLLSGWTPDVTNLSELAPYIFARVKAALFVPSETALASVSFDEHTQHAIGPFIDNYQYALSAHIPEATDAREKKVRLMEVWEYVTGPLSERGMDADEAARYWKEVVPHHLQSTLSKILPEMRHETWPVIPKLDDPLETHEWNPLENRPADVKIEERKLGHATYIDFSVLSNRAQCEKIRLQSCYELPVPQVPPLNISIGSIWGVHSTEAEKEASALAALLYLDTKYGSAERILTVPFPSQNDVRYTCLYLDEDFLTRDDLRVQDAAAYLSSHLGLVPLPLVHALSANLVGRFGRKQNPRLLDEAAFTLIRGLSESDTPGLAFGLAIKVIIGQPSTSSWHRMLFHNGFLQRLPASDARACIARFAEAIGEKLDAQRQSRQCEAAERQEGEITGDKTAQTVEGNAPQVDRPFVKVTTLKSLAQVLHGSTYIGDDVSLEILSSLLKKTSHIDVQLSILRTLLSKLDDLRSDLWDRILSSLEIYIPLAGSLDEREPIIDNDSTRAEGTSTVPKIQLTTRNNWREESPVLDALVKQYTQLKNFEIKELFLRRVMLPTLEVLKQQTAKWATMFVRQYAPENFKVLETVLPPIPRGVTTLELILSGANVDSSYIPQRLLDEYVAYLTFRIDPPEAIRAFNKILADKPAVNSKPEVVSWFELYGNGIEATWLYRLPFTCITNFADQERENGETFVTRRSWQKKWLEVFMVLLRADDPQYRYLKIFVSTLTNPYNTSSSWWIEYGRTTIEAMLAYTNGIRTRDWELNTNRKFNVLPDTFNWRLSLLPYPLSRSFRDNDNAREQACKTFAHKLSTILDDISSSMYHNKWAQIQNRICNSRNLSNQDFKDNLLLTALYLGDITKTRLSWLTTPDLLRVDLAAQMVLEVRGMSNGALGPRLKDMLENWISSENEEVRRTGYRVQDEYYDADSKRVEIPLWQS